MNQGEIGLGPWLERPNNQFHRLRKLVTYTAKSFA